ncbi:hypothetical protein ABIF33_001944 [Bradyrhizobium elkanii]
MKAPVQRTRAFILDQDAACSSSLVRRSNFSISAARGALSVPRSIPSGTLRKASSRYSAPDRGKPSSTRPEVLEDRSDVAARHAPAHAIGQSAVENGRDRPAQQRHHRAQRVGLAGAKALPELDAFLEQRDQERADIICRRMIERPRTGRQRQRFAPDPGRKQFQVTPEVALCLDADGASAQSLERDVGIGKHLHRMKSAGRGACGFRMIERGQFGRAAAMNHAVPRLPAQIAAHRQDRVIAHGEENHVAAVDDLLRVRHRQRRRDAGSEPLRGIGTAVVERRDVQPRAGEGWRKRLRHTAGADEADPQRRQRPAHCA